MGGGWGKSEVSTPARRRCRETCHRPSPVDTDRWAGAASRHPARGRCAHDEDDGGRSVRGAPAHGIGGGGGAGGGGRPRRWEGGGFLFTPAFVFFAGHSPPGRTRTPVRGPFSA